MMKRQGDVITRDRRVLNETQKEDSVQGAAAYGQDTFGATSTNSSRQI
jgi:hypothetical protein